MVSEDRLSRMGKDDGNGNSSSAASDSAGLRRSSRERSGQKPLAVSSSSIRKSDRIENRSPSKPGEGGAGKNAASPSPLRRSDRGKVPAASPELKNSGKSSGGPVAVSQKKVPKEKSVTKLSMETVEVGRSGKEKTGKRLKGGKHLKSNKFKGLYMTPKIEPDVLDDSANKKKGNLSQGDGNNSRGELDVVDKTGTNERVVSGDQKARGAFTVTQLVNVEPDIGLVNYSENEKEKEAELVVSLLRGETSDDDLMALNSDKETVPSKRKIIMLELDSDISSTNVSKRVCTLNVEAAASVEECDASSHRLRVELDPTGEGIFSHDANINKDREEVEAHTTAGIAEKRSNSLYKRGSPTSLPSVREQFVCLTCKLGGTLLCCEGSGCKGSYHFSCLDPAMDGIPVGVWYCLRCVKKKLECGVHSVSEGVESIWDFKEVKVLDVDGLRKEREFFVKYKGLAHIHNRWVPESKLLLDAPALISKFNRKSQGIKWKPEWTIPHRLLGKRLLMSPEQRELYVTEHVGKKLDSHYEWLVKWCGLGYDDMTWELDSASLFKSPDGQGLIENYESRYKRDSSKVDKIPVRENCKSDKLSQLRAGTSSATDCNFHEYTVKLHEFWYKEQNAIVIDEQANERIKKTISLVQSFQPNNCRPFLIISSSAALHSWDTEFLKWAPHLNVVVYSGNKDLRKLIRKLEFYVEGGGLITFQVLVTTLEIVLEDLDFLLAIQWELLVIDESQRTRMSSHCTQIKLLNAERRLLILSSLVKENVAEYNNLLCLFESPKDSPHSNSLLTGSADNFVNLKEKLSRYIVHQRKSDSSRFREYWVPLKMANLQLEQYCATLISNSATLCAPHTSVSAGTLRDVLLSSRKCCDHPYIVDKSIPERLSEGLPPSEYLDFGINASGKFQLLDMMLSELKKQGLRALILLQDFGKDCIGDLLEDFLQQRFGPDSFERIVVGIQPAKKQAALNKFNNDSNRFVFLIETRAGLSMKLSSINTVIIFGSDWNPMNDVRALQKVTLDPLPEQIPIFRLFVSHTLEEKVLSNAVKQERNIDTNLQNLSRNTIHTLLMWGASHQFKSLDEFHQDTVMDSHEISRVKKLSLEVGKKERNTPLESAVQEIFQIISSNSKDTETRRSSIISCVEIVGGAYHTESSLPGELQSKVMDAGEPHISWMKLLEGKHPQWKYISGSTQRNRKKVQYKEAVSEEAVKKRRRVVNSVDSPSPELESAGITTPRLSEGNESICANSASASPLDFNIIEVLQNKKFETEEQIELREAQKSLLLSLKPGVEQLCKILEITGISESLVNEFLEYMMSNHHVSSDSPTMQQAFQISLIWTAASMTDLKIDHQQSVDLARQHLKFNCRKDEVEFAYSMLRCFKTIFAYRTGKLKAESLSLSKYTRNDVMKCISQIQKKYQKKLQKLIQQQEEEKERIMRRYEEDKLKIQTRLKYESIVIRACCEENTSMRQDKLRSVDISSAKELEEIEKKRDASLKMLEEEELAAKKMFQEKKASWLGAVKSWVCPELFGKTFENDPSNFSELLQTNEARLNNGVSNVPLSPAEQIRNGLTTGGPEKVVQQGFPETILSHEDGPSLEDETHTAAPQSVVVDTIQPSVPENVARLEVQPTLPSIDVVQNLESEDRRSSENQDPGITSSTSLVNEIQLEEVSSGNDAVNVGSSIQLPSEEQLPDTAIVDVPNEEVSSSMPELCHSEVEANRFSEENNEMVTVTSTGSISHNQQESPNNAVDQIHALQDPSQINSSCVLPETASNNADPVPSNQASQDECNLPSLLSDIQLEGSSTADLQNASQAVERPVSQPVDTAEPNQHVHEATDSEPASQVVISPSSESLSKEDSASVPLITETPRSGQVSQSAAELSANNPPVSNPPNLLPVGPIPINLSGSRTRPTVPESNNRPIQPVMTLFSPAPYVDPLQKELERLSGELEGVRKSYEDTKLKLKLEREKEIEEINRKYNLKNQETDANFSSRKKELDDRHSKVLLNKILAEAFRAKCTEIRTTKVNGSSSTRLPVQQNAVRPLLVSQSSTNSPVARMQTRGTELNPSISIPGHTTSARNTLPAHASVGPLAVAVTAASNIPPAIALQTVRLSTASSGAARPPQVSSISYSNGIPQVSAQMSTRPPHLRGLSSPATAPPHHRGNPSTLPISTPLSDPVGQRPRPETSRESTNMENLASVYEASRNQPTQGPLVGFPSPPSWLDVGSVLDHLNVSGPTGLQINQRSASGPIDVVCLSDDD